MLRQRKGNDRIVDHLVSFIDSTIVESRDFFGSDNCDFIKQAIDMLKMGTCNLDEISYSDSESKVPLSFLNFSSFYDACGLLNQETQLELKVITDSAEHRSKPPSRSVHKRIRDAGAYVKEYIYRAPFLEQRLYRQNPLNFTTIRELPCLNERDFYIPEMSNFESKLLIQSTPDERKTVQSMLSQRLGDKLNCINPVDCLNNIFDVVYSIQSKIVVKSWKAHFKIFPTDFLKNEFEVSIVNYLFLHEKHAADVACLIHDDDDVNILNVLHYYCKVNIKRNRRLLMIFHKDTDMASFNQVYPTAIPIFDADDYEEFADEHGCFMIMFSDWLRGILKCKDTFYATIFFRVPFDSENCEKLKNVANDEILKLGIITMVVKYYVRELNVLPSIAKFIMRSVFVATGLLKHKDFDGLIELYALAMLSEDEIAHAVPLFISQLSYHPRLRRRVVPEIMYHPAYESYEANFIARSRLLLPFLAECKKLKRRVCVLVNYEFEHEFLVNLFEHEYIDYGSCDSLKYGISREVVGISSLNVVQKFVADDVVVFDKFNPETALSILNNLDTKSCFFDLRVIFFHTHNQGIKKTQLQEIFNDYSDTPVKLHDYNFGTPQCFDTWQDTYSPKKDDKVNIHGNNLINDEHKFAVTTSKTSMFFVGKRSNPISEDMQELYAYAATLAPPEPIVIEEEEEEVPPTPVTPANPEAPPKPLSKRAQQRARANARKAAEAAAKLAEAAAVATPTVVEPVETLPPIVEPTPQAPPKPAEKVDEAPPPSAAVPQVSKKALERMAIERIRSRLPSFVRGYHHGAPFGPPTDASLMRRTNTSLVVCPLIQYFIAKVMVKYSLFGNYFRMLYIDGKYNKTRSSFFSWDGAQQYVNRIAHPTARPIHRCLLNKEFFITYFKKTIIYFTMKCNHRTVVHSRDYYRELVEYCKEGMPLYSFEENMTKNSLKTTFVSFSVFTIETFKASVLNVEVEMGVLPPLMEDIDDFWLDAFYYRPRPTCPQLLIICNDIQRRYLRVKHPLAFAKGSVWSGSVRRSMVLYYDVCRNIQSKITLKPSTQLSTRFVTCPKFTVQWLKSSTQNTKSVSAVATSVTQPKKAFSFNTKSKKEMFKYHKNVIFKVPEVPLSEAHTPVTPSSNDASKDVPVEKALEFEPMSEDETVEYASVDTIGAHRLRLRRQWSPKLSSKSTFLRGVYPMEKSFFWDKFINLSSVPDKPPAMKWLHSLRMEKDVSLVKALKTTVHPDLKRKIEVVETPLPVVRPVQVPSPPKIQRIIPSIGANIPILMPKNCASKYKTGGVSQSLSSTKVNKPSLPPTLTIIRPIPALTRQPAALPIVRPLNPIVRVRNNDSGIPNFPAKGGRKPPKGKKKSPDVMVVTEIKRPHVDRVPEVVIVGETTFTRPKINDLERLKAQKRAMSQPPMFVIPKKRVKLPTKIIIKHSRRFYVQGRHRPTPPRYQKLPNDGEKRCIRSNLPYPTLRLLQKSDDYLPSVHTISTLGSCHNLQKKLLRKLKCLKKSDYDDKKARKHRKSNEYFKESIQLRRDAVLSHKGGKKSKRPVSLRKKRMVRKSLKGVLKKKPTIKLKAEPKKKLNVAAKKISKKPMLKPKPTVVPNVIPKPVATEKPKEASKDVKEKQLELKKPNSELSKITNTAPMVLLGIPKVMQYTLSKITASRLAFRDLLIKVYLGRSVNSKEVPKTGVRFSDTSVATMNSLRYKVLKNVLNSYPVRGLSEKDLMAIASAQRAFQTSTPHGTRGIYNLPSSQVGNVRIITPRQGQSGMRPRTTTIRSVSLTTVARPIRLPFRMPNPVLLCSRRIGSGVQSCDFHSKDCTCAQPHGYPMSQFEACVKILKNFIFEIVFLMQRRTFLANNSAYHFESYDKGIANVIRNWRTWKLAPLKLFETGDNRRLTFDEAIAAVTLNYKQKRRFVFKKLCRRKKFNVFTLFRKKVQPRPKCFKLPMTGGITCNLSNFQDIIVSRCRERCKRRQQTMMLLRGINRHDTLLWLRQYEYRFNFKMFDIFKRKQRRIPIKALRKIMFDCKSTSLPTQLRCHKDLERFSCPDNVDYPTRPLAFARRRSNSFCGARSSRNIVILPGTMDDINIRLSSITVNKDVSKEPPKSDSLIRNEWITGYEGINIFKRKVNPLKKFSLEMCPTKEVKKLRKPRKRRDCIKPIISRKYLTNSRTRGPSSFLVRRRQRPTPSSNKYACLRRRFNDVYPIWRRHKPPPLPNFVTDLITQDLI